FSNPTSDLRTSTGAPAARREIPRSLLRNNRLRWLPGGANQFAGGSRTRRRPAPFTRHFFASYVLKPFRKQRMLQPTASGVRTIVSFLIVAVVYWLSLWRI